MAGWTAEELAAIGQADELRITSRRTDGSLRRYVVVWVVRSGDDLYVRSAYGPDNGWFRRARASMEGRIRAAGAEWDVTFEVPGESVDAELHRAYHAKYDRYGKRLVATVTSTDAARSTLRLVPRSATPG